jgi:hypothetical protein
MSAIPPLSGDKETSGGPVAIGAFDPKQSNLIGIRLLSSILPSCVHLLTYVKSVIVPQDKNRSIL